MARRLTDPLAWVRTRALTALGVATALLAGPVVVAPVLGGGGDGARAAVATSGTPTPAASVEPSTAAQAASAVDAVAADVRALTAEYVRRSAAAEQAAQELASTFAVDVGAQDAADAAQDALRRARTRQAATIRVLYQQGEQGLFLSALTADSPDDALWRLSTSARLAKVLLRADGQDVRSRQARVEAANAAADAVDAASLQLARALGRLQDETSRAAQALDTAKARLAGLTAAQQRLQAAEEAAKALAAAQAAAQAARLAAAGPVTALQIPAAYEATYRSAAHRCPGMRWTLLAAVGQVESGHGRNNGPSSAGAVGPMQFMPATFAVYGVDGNGDSRTDPWDFRDAIPSAARYLCASGAGKGDDGVRRALFAYNHAQWYVDLVLSAERSLVARAETAAPGQPAAGGDPQG